MRSGREIVFRLRQESANLRLAAFPPHLDVDVALPLASFPAPPCIAARLGGTACADEIQQLASQILHHELPVLGTHVVTGAEIPWRRDPIRGVESSAVYFRRIPYLDVKRSGDHKLIWELNRHQHLVLLAQAFVLNGDRALLEEIREQFESWQRANPFQRGINWASALEVAFRALSWIWIIHLTGQDIEAQLRRAILAELYRHGKHLERNLSVYFSPNTHLLGEAVVLHALGKLFPEFPNAQKWERSGAAIVRQQLDTQVREDGSHFEQSSYYQIYAVDMFLLHGLLIGLPDDYRQKLALMAGYLHSLHSPGGRLPLIGDDDGGRLFYPYGERALFGRATLATCAIVLNRPEWIYEEADLHQQAVWWLTLLPVPPPPSSQKGVSKLFAHVGMAVLRCVDVHALIDVGPFGAGSAGHSHSDTLSIIASAAAEEILIDSGTYTYVGEARWRDRFRGSAAHNTVRIQELDQATPAGPFRWVSKPTVRLHRWDSSEVRDYMHATCEYSGFRHHRRCLFLKPDRIWILDEIDGPPGEYLVEQFWHPGERVEQRSADEFSIGSRSVLVLSGGRAELTIGGDFGWRSCALAEKHESPVIRVARRATLPGKMAAVLDFSGQWRFAPRESDKMFLKQFCFGSEFDS